MEAEEMAKADDDDAGSDAGSGGATDHHASVVADLLVESGKYPHRAAALHHVLHSARGQALLARMHKKESPMQDTVLSIMKSGGIAATCAVIVAKGNTTISEHELVEAASKVAAERYPGLTEAQAFDKVYSDRGEEGQALRSTVAIAKPPLRTLTRKFRSLAAQMRKTLTIRQRRSQRYIESAAKAGLKPVKRSDLLARSRPIPSLR
jgi:hypothetical protein